jgi:anti-sigma B factor antagonist
MELKVLERDDGVTHVALIGSLDIQGLHKIDMQFHCQTAAKRQPAIVDMSQVDFISSLGMGMLISCGQSLQRHVKVRMVLLKPQPMVETALKTARLDLVLPIVHDLDEALQLARPK